MKTLHPDSLVKTLDAVTEAHFFGTEIPEEERRCTVDWLVTRVGRYGGYRGMPAPTPLDFAEPFCTFTGDPIEGRAPISHILGEEAIRAMIWLGSEDPCVTEAVGRSYALVEAEHPEASGWYCCGKCSVALWRHWLMREDKAEALDAALQRLRERRRPNGWLRLPFFYTLLALSEMPQTEAVEELREVAPLMERLLKVRRLPPYAERRTALLERALARV